MPSNIHEMLETNNRQMVRLLEKNHDLSAFFLAFTDHCVEWCQRRGVPFEELRIHRPYIANFDGDEVVAAPLTRR